MGTFMVGKFTNRIGVTGYKSGISCYGCVFGDKIWTLYGGADTFDSDFVAGN